MTTTLSGICSVEGCRIRSGEYTTANRCAKHDAMLKLATRLRPGQTVYTILRHTSRSGMSRSISTIIHDADGQLLNITPLVARALGAKVDQTYGGVKVYGAGMDLGFHLVNSLSSIIFPEYRCTGRDGSGDDRCPSNEHVNPPRPAPDGKMMHADGCALRQRWL